jgi:predicted aminopeptidase
MLRWRETRLVGTIFHELAHERLYFAGDSEFNEAFASVVEAAGVRLWLERAGRPADLERLRVEVAREIEFSALLRTTRDRLDTLYRSGLATEAMRIAKQREFGLLKFEYEQLRARWGGYAGYDNWFAQPLNNARLAAVATYRDCAPGLQRMLEQAGSLPAFYERAAALGRLTVRERHAQVCRP